MPPCGIMLDTSKRNVVGAQSESDASVMGIPTHSSALSGTRWYCVALLSNLERLAEAALIDLGFQTLFLKEAVRPKQSEPWRLRQLFPGYGFVSFDAASDPWYKIADTPGVYRLIKHGPIKPTPLPIGAIEVFQAMADERGVIYPPETRPLEPIKVDAICRPLDDLYQNISGICEWSDGKRVRLLTNLLGGKIRVTLDVSRVEVLA